MEEKQAIAALAALAQESRLRAFRLLVQSGTRGISAGRIARALDIPPATLSFHLKELAQAGIVIRRRSGRSINYSLDIAGVRALLGFLMEDCCAGRPELCQPPTADGTGTEGCCPNPRRRKSRGAGRLVR
jgi:DNA-binding transcriptional ArsR family regulator